MVKNAILLNIDEELSVIERIFDKYIPDVSGSVFTSTRRFPISSRVNLSKIEKSFLSNRPYLPYKCVDFVTKYIVDEIYRNTVIKCHDIYSKNHLLSYGTGVNFINFESDDIGYRLRLYVEQYDPRDLTYIEKILLSVRDSVFNVIDLCRSNVYEVDYKTHRILLFKKCDIWEFRYLELLEERELFKNTL